MKYFYILFRFSFCPWSLQCLWLQKHGIHGVLYVLSQNLKTLPFAYYKLFNYFLAYCSIQKNATSLSHLSWTEFDYVMQARWLLRVFTFNFFLLYHNETFKTLITAHVHHSYTINSGDITSRKKHRIDHIQFRPDILF